MTLQARIESLSTDKLQECATGLFAHADNAASEALSAILIELEQRMEETEYVAWCDANF